MAQTGNRPTIAEAVERGEAPGKQHWRLEWGIDDAGAQFDALRVGCHVAERFEMTSGAETPSEVFPMLICSPNVRMTPKRAPPRVFSGASFENYQRKSLMGKRNARAMQSLPNFSLNDSGKQYIIPSTDMYGGKK